MVKSNRLNHIGGFIQMKEYIEDKIRNFISDNNFAGYLERLASVDSDIKAYWKAEKNRNNEVWRNIRTNKDVLDLIDRFDGVVTFVEEYVPFGKGHIEDAYNMALAEYRALQGLTKLARFIDPSQFNNTEFTMLSESDIDAIFERMTEIATRMNQQNMRRAMQD